jgi:ATP-binding cassette subfamily B protein
MTDNTDKKAARAARMEARRAKYAGGAATATAEMTDEEREEAEQAEKARLQGGGMFDGPAPGKASQFGPSFTRMIGLLKPSAVWFVLVSIFGAIGVVLRPRCSATRRTSSTRA